MLKIQVYTGTISGPPESDLTLIELVGMKYCEVSWWEGLWL